MGCVESKPVVEKAPPQPIPTLEELGRHRFELLPKEPVLPHFKDYVSRSELVRVAVRKSHKAGVGDSYKVLSIQPNEKGVDEAHGAWRELNVEPALLVPGARRNMQDLLCVRDYANEKSMIAFFVKDVSRGPNRFQILSPEPIRPNQVASKWKGPSKQELYPLARINFDTESTICHVHLSGQKDSSEAIFTMRAGSKHTWIVLRRGETCALFEETKSVMRTFKAYDCSICPGVDPVFMISLCCICDAFNMVAAKSGWKMYPETPVETTAEQEQAQYEKEVADMSEATEDDEVEEEA